MLGYMIMDILISYCWELLYTCISTRSVDDRYALMCEVARTRSILSFGLSCFKLVLPPGDLSESDAGTKIKLQGLTFSVQTFNIFMLCSEDYVVEPLSLKFLVDHGFDFNKQYSVGLPYCRGNDKVFIFSDIGTNFFNNFRTKALIWSRKPL